MKKVLGVLLVLALVAPGFAQKVFVEEHGEKPIKGFPEDPIIETAGTKDVTKAHVLVCYVLDDSNTISQVISRSQNSVFKFVVEYTASKNCKVRFHFVWVGHKLTTYDSTNWYSASLSKYSWITLTDYYPSSWVAGTYKMIVFCEVKNSSGAAASTECVFRVY